MLVVPEQYITVIIYRPIFIQNFGRQNDPLKSRTFVKPATNDSPPPDASFTDKVEEASADPDFDEALEKADARVVEADARIRRRSKHGTKTDPRLHLIEPNRFSAQS